MTRSTRLFSIFAFSAFMSAGLVLGASTARADGEAEAKCTTKKFKHKKVEAACAKDGRKGAKTLMKKLVKEQKAAGNDINCKSCHTSLKTFELKDNAGADLDKYLK
jgi:cytochrome c